MKPPLDRRGTRPGTKAYRRRLDRLAFRLEWQIADPTDESLTDVLLRHDPSMPAEMRIKAIDVAIEQASMRADELKIELANLQRGLRQLEELRAASLRWPTVIDAANAWLRQASLGARRRQR